MRVLNDIPMTGAEKVADSMESITVMLTMRQQFFDQFSGAACMPANTTDSKAPEYVDMFPPTENWATPAKLLCAQCIHTDTCFETAIERGEKFGVWGGSTEKERNKIRDAHNVVAQAAAPRRIVSLARFATLNRAEFVAPPDPEADRYSPESYEKQRYIRKKPKTTK